MDNNIGWKKPAGGLDADESLRDSVTIAVDIYLDSVNNRMNEILKVLTGVSVVLLPWSLVTGIFGMNITVMPGLRHPAEFWWTIGGMGMLSLILLCVFRRFRLF